MLRKLLIIGMILVATLELSAFQIAKDGKACCVIVIPTLRNEYEARAAEDLKEHLEKITGAKFEIYSDNVYSPKKSDKSPNPAIFVGPTIWGTAYGFDPVKLKYASEEWLVSTRGGNNAMFILGGRPIGTYYAVWRFLESIGCWPLTWDQTTLPHKPTLSVTTEKHGKPTFELRFLEADGFAFNLFSGMPYRNEKAYTTWLLRVGANRILDTDRSKAEYVNIDYYIPTYPYHHHSLCFWVNPEKYFKEHPEYYTMNEFGKRVPPRTLAVGGSLCMTNPEVSRVTYENIRNYILRQQDLWPKDQRPRLYDISVLDNTPYFCKCPACSKIVAEEEASAALLLMHVNRVARMLAKEFPDIQIRTSTYAAASKQPKHTVVEKNVLLELDDPFPTADCFRPVTSEFNKQNRETLENWARASKNLEICDYWNLNGGSHRPNLDTVIDTLKPDFQFFKELGVKALYIEIDRDHIVPQPFYDLNMFVAYQLMLDLNQDTEELIDIFLDGYYDKAAPVMREYLTSMRNGMKAQKNKQTCLLRSYWTYLTPEFMAKTCRDLHNAAALYPEGSIFRRRIETELLTVNWVALLNRNVMEPVFRKAGIDMDKLYDECVKFSYDYRARMGGDPARSADQFAQKVKQIAKCAQIAVPQQFAKIPAADIRVLSHYEMESKPFENAFLIADPTSPTGKSLRIGSKTPHGVNEIITAHEKSFPVTLFAMENVTGNKQSLQLRITDIPQDEQYHWYRLPGVIDLEERSWFWGYGYAIDIDTNQIYTVGDGISKHNQWECRFSVKFTGPAYVKGSKQENAIYINYVVMTRPGVFKD